MVSRHIHMNWVRSWGYWWTERQVSHISRTLPSLMSRRGQHFWQAETLCLYFLQCDFRVLGLVQCMFGIPACTKSSEREVPFLSLGSEASSIYSMGRLLLEVKANCPMQKRRHSCHFLWEIHKKICSHNTLWGNKLYSHMQNNKTLSPKSERWEWFLQSDSLRI